MIKNVKYFEFTVLVHDFDETIKFYTNALGFEVCYDNKIANGRWVSLRRKGAEAIRISLKKPQSEGEEMLIGKQVGSGFLFQIHVEDLENLYKDMVAQGVHFDKELIQTPYADFAYLKDNNGNNIILSEFWIKV